MVGCRVRSASVLAILLAVSMLFIGGNALAQKGGKGKGKKGDSAQMDGEGKKGKHKAEGKGLGKEKGPGEGLGLGKEKGPGEGKGLGKEKGPGEGKGLGKEKGPGEGLGLGKGRGKGRGLHSDRPFARRKRFKPEVKAKLIKSAKAKTGPKAKERRKHLKRMAKLRRIQEMAATKGDGELAQRVSKIMIKERKRHQKAYKKNNL